MPQTDFTGRRVLVVGASSGIGRSIALTAAAGGARVAVAARRRDLLQTVANQAGALAVPADLADPDDCARIAEQALAGLGGIDLVVHCAAVSPITPITKTTAPVWQRLFATNVVGPLLVTSHLLPELSPGSVTAFVSSRSVGRPYHGVGAYSASKAALDQALLSLRLEHPRHRFTRVEVGDTAGTDFNRDFDLDTRKELLPLWLAHGALSETLLDCDDVSELISASLAQLLDRPGISANNLVFHGAGGIITSPDQRPMVGTHEGRRHARAGAGGQQV
ncbi:SDR family NAD(P)-dependent oxidoreductase [Streptomyces sp. NPDC101234]|uniref:SDR family NAD(P)-dependent oxidoreductase n=1 Tax=Streptomyces sp. NPDC101234 TaxID=3366138 RepID=UPI00380D0DCD